MPDFAFAIPGDLNLPTGGYAYDRRVIAGLKRLGWDCRHLRLPADFPKPSHASLNETSRALRSLPAESAVLFDGLAFGAVPAEVLDQQNHRYAALCHHPLSLEAGLAKADAEKLFHSERIALSRARAVIVTSPATAEILAKDYGVARERITAALPGTEPAPRAKGSGSAPLVLAAGAVVPRKRYPVLIQALAAMRGLEWTCTIAGSLTRDAAEAEAVRGLIAAEELQQRVTLAGAVSDTELAALYARAEVFALASEYEGYGMVFAEALARGLPVVATSGGAIPGTVPRQAGLLVPPGDAPAFARALRRMVESARERANFSDAAWAHARTLPRWDDTAKTIAGVLQQVSA